MLNHYATIRRAPRITKMMEATIAEDPPGVEVVVSGSGNIGSSALHLSWSSIFPNLFHKLRYQPVIGAEADLDVGDGWDVVVVREGGVVDVEARVGVFTAVVVSSLNLSNIWAAAVLGDQLGVVAAGSLIDSEQRGSNIKLLGGISPDNFLLHGTTAVGAFGHDVSGIGKVWTILGVSFREWLWFSTVENPVATVVTLQGAVDWNTGCCL